MIKLSEPFFFGDELYYLRKCINDKWISSGGKYTRIFENKIKKFTNGKYNLGLVNCTSALQLAVRLLDPKKEDEIILPSITFVSTTNSVVYNNCKPIFMDCDDNLLLDKRNFFNFIQSSTYFKKGFTYNKKTKKRIIAIIIVNTFGNLFDYDKKFLSFCRKKNIKIIEDSAESLGSKYKHKKKINNITFSCYSFNGNKLVTAGGGGIISTNNKKDYIKAKYLSSQAKRDPINFVHDDVGYNFRISNIHASIGLAQLNNLPKILKKKKIIHNLYIQGLKNIPGLKILKNPKYSLSNNWLNILSIDKKKYGLGKKQVIQKFLNLKIETRSLWYPSHLQKPFKKFEKFNIKRSKDFFERCLCLPSSFSLKTIDQKKIINCLKTKFL
mgnify:CR=1 FL=1|tara:strand:+ start:4384 stop:5532 length:1149 start_codon:yes stop_codon:yes gene_type:complete